MTTRERIHRARCAYRAGSGRKQFFLRLTILLGALARKMQPDLSLAEALPGTRRVSAERSAKRDSDSAWNVSVMRVA